MKTLKDKYTFLGISLALVASIVCNIQQESRLHRIEQYKKTQIEFYARKAEVTAFECELLERCIVSEAERERVRLVAKYCEAKLDAAKSIPVEDE
jgi:hypothetical protein